MSKFLVFYKKKFKININIMEIEKDLEEVRKIALNQMWYIDYNELIIDTVPFASGATSEIFNCKWRGINIVIKKLKVKDNFTLKDFLNEIKIWHTIRHPNIVQFLGISIFADEIFILLQKINGPNLKEYIKSNLKLKKKEIATQLISIFNFLHNCNPPIIYRDLKAENILIENNKIYLTDFGISRIYPENSNFKMTGDTGTLRYMAPEVFKKEYYNLKADVYSLGMLLYFIYKKELPFSGFNRKSIIDYFESDHNFNVVLSDKKIKFIIENCTNKDINKRFNIYDLSLEIEKVSNRKYCCKLFK